MNTHSRAFVAILALTALSACTALTPKKPVVTQEKPAQADTKLDPAEQQKPAEPVAAPRPTNAMGEKLQNLIQQRVVTELRTTYNGNYGASLLFDPHELQYYVALFYNKDFWKVEQTQDQKRAEQLYSQYANKSKQLAEADLNRIRLQANYAHTEAELSQHAEELQSIQSSLEAQREQARQISAQQAISRQESARLKKQQADAEKKLRELQKTIRELKAQQAKLR